MEEKNAARMEEIHGGRRFVVKGGRATHALNRVSPGVLWALCGVSELVRGNPRQPAAEVTCTECLRRLARISTPTG